MERPLTYVFTHAICAYRDARAAESRSLWAQALALGTPTSYGGDERLILVDKALRAAEESDEAHRLLETGIENPEELPMDADLRKMWRHHNQHRVDAAYERAEAKIETMVANAESLRRYGWDMA